MDVGRAPEDAELADVLDDLGSPSAVTLDMLAEKARYLREDFYAWLTDRKNRRQIPHRMESAGYVPVRNDMAQDGLWRIRGRRQAVYAVKTLPPPDRMRAATQLTR